MASLPRHLLVVDDEPHIGVLFRMQFERRGYRVTVARTLAEARRVLAAGSPDLLLLDIHLPDGLGLDLLAEVRKRPATAQLPVLILTAEGDEHILRETDRLGATVLTKPFSPSKLTARMLQLLGESPTAADENPA
ncbi:MAG TPA: response regulator [Gemmatimonadales bacterium]